MATSGYLWTYEYSTAALLNPRCMNEHAVTPANAGMKASGSADRQAYISIDQQTDRQNVRQSSAHTYLGLKHAGRQTNVHISRQIYRRQAGRQ